MEKASVSKKTIRLKNPNPLFEMWLSEWHSEEATAENQTTIYSKALESLRKYPLVLKSGLECIILEHFDESLCLKINKKFLEHSKEIGVLTSECDSEKFIKNKRPDKKDEVEPVKITKRKTNRVPELSSSPQSSPLKKKAKPYLPAKRSAAYGLLKALYLMEDEKDYCGYLTKSELVIKAQAHCDVSLSKPAPGTYYSGWSSMSQLVSKGLVQRSGNPAKFALTEDGRELALKLKGNNDYASSQVCQNKPKDCSTMILPSKTAPPKVLSPSKHQDRTTKKKEVPDGCETFSQSQEFETEEMIFLPSSFDIILLVDTAETVGAAKRDEDEAIIALKSTSIKFEVRHLKVGDYIWIARDAVGREMVLPYIVERKCLGDLSSSIKDGRFHEQKFRIKQCGLPNRIYLVEDSGNEKSGLPSDSILSAITNTMVCDKFSVRITKNILESMRYLSTLTNILTRMFQNKTLFSCKKDDLPANLNLEDDIISLMSFSDFSYNMGKNKMFTPREIFVKQLVQLHGLSVDKAWAISEHYSTPKNLIEGFLYDDAEKSISQLTSGLLERKVGSQIAATLKSFYTTLEFTG